MSITPMLLKKNAIFYALVAVLLWSTVATAFKLSLNYLSPIQLLFYASLTSFLSLLLIITAQNKFKLLLNTFSSAKWYYLALGALNPWLYYLILFKAYELLPAQQAQPLNYTWAITLTMLSIPLLKHKVNRFDSIAAVMGYLGVVVIATKGNILAFQFESVSGVILALLSTVVWALYWIFNTKNKNDPVVSLCLCFGLSLPLCAATVFFFDNFHINSWPGLAGAIYVGLFEMGITFLFWLLALKNATSTAKISNLIFLSPFLSLFFIAQFVGETIHIATFGGLVLIISGLLVQQWGNQKLIQRKN